jgi:hypothetical protein
LYTTSSDGYRRIQVHLTDTELVFGYRRYRCIRRIQSWYTDTDGYRRIQVYRRIHLVHAYRRIQVYRAGCIQPALTDTDGYRCIRRIQSWSCALASEQTDTDGYRCIELVAYRVGCTQPALTDTELAVCDTRLASGARQHCVCTQALLASGALRVHAGTAHGRHWTVLRKEKRCWA